MSHKQSFSRIPPDPTTMANRILTGFVFGIAVLLLVAGPTFAQQTTDEESRHTVVLRDVPLDEALQTFIQRTNTDIGYSNELVSDRRTYCRIREATPDELLQCILKDTGVDYVTTSGGAYLLVNAFQAPDATGRITGTVVDAATGEPLPRANVLLADASTGMATNQAGRFTFSPVLAGSHRIVVTHVGYESAVDSVWVPPSERKRVRIPLERQPLTAEPLIVDGLQQRLPSFSLGTNQTERDQLRTLTALGTPDVMRNASQNVGVTLNQPRADLHVQGGDTGEHVTLLDGVPVREPATLGGLVSAFSPQSLRRVQVHKTGFPAEHGSYTAGVIAAEHDLARSRTRHVTATVDPISVNMRGEAGWNRHQEGTGHAMVAARTGIWEAYQSPALRHRLSTWTQPDPMLATWWIDSDPGPVRNIHQPTPDVRFSDIHAAAQHELSPFHQVYVSGYRGSNQMQTDASSQLTSNGETHHLNTQGRTGWTNSMLQVRHEWLASDRVSGRIQAYGSRHRSDSFFGLHDARSQSAGSDAGAATPDHALEENELDEWGGRVATEISLSSNYRLNASLAPTYMRGRVHVRNRFLGGLDHRVGTWHFGGHLEGEASLGLGTTATASTRLTYLSSRQTVYAEPRFALRYDQSSSPLGGLAVRVAGGLYRQYVLQSEISNDGPMAAVPSMRFWLPVDESVAPPRAYHTAADLLLMPTRSWTVQLETYYKWQPRILHIDYAGLVHQMPFEDTRDAVSVVAEHQADFMAAGSGRTYGTALSVKRSGARVDAEVTAELERAQRQYAGRFDARFVPAPWEQPMRLGTNLAVQIVDGVQALGSWQGIWGRSWALRRAYYDYTALTHDGQDRVGVDLSRPGDQQLAPFSRIDLGLKAEREVGGVGLHAQLNVVNVLDRANPYDWSLDTRSRPPEPLPRSLPGRHVFLLLGIRY